MTNRGCLAGPMGNTPRQSANATASKRTTKPAPPAHPPAPQQSPPPRPAASPWLPPPPSGQLPCPPPAWRARPRPAWFRVLIFDLVFRLSLAEQTCSVFLALARFIEHTSPTHKKPQPPPKKTKTHICRLCPRLGQLLIKQRVLDRPPLSVQRLERRQLRLFGVQLRQLGLDELHHLLDLRAPVLGLLHDAQRLAAPLFVDLRGWVEGSRGGGGEVGQG